MNGLGDTAMTEEWRVSGIAPDYEISSFGRVRRRFDFPKSRYKAGETLRSFVNGGGYLALQLKIDGRMRGKLVHVLVCDAFKGPKPSDKHEVAHWDGIRTNNHCKNLRWATRKENMADAKRMGRTFPGESHRCAKLKEFQVLDILKDKRSNDIVGLEYNVSRHTINNIRKGRVWRHLTAEHSL